MMTLLSEMSIDSSVSAIFNILDCLKYCRNIIDMCCKNMAFLLKAHVTFLYYV